MRKPAHVILVPDPGDCKPGGLRQASSAILPPLLTPTDNAPMDADPPKRKRRWFQFSLRTLLIGVTLLAVLSAAVTWVIQDRQRLVRERDEAMGREADAKQTLNTMQQENRVLVNQLHQIYREQPGSF